MKAFVSLLTLSAAFLSGAQSRDASSRVEGDYESFQWGREIHRTLRLDRDGNAEIVTEVSGDPADLRPNERDEYARYGWTASEAARGRAVHQTGRWTLRGDRVELRLDAVRDRSGFRTRGREDADLRFRDGELVLANAESMYGREDVEFRAMRNEAVRERPDVEAPVPLDVPPAAPRRFEYDGSLRVEGGLISTDKIEFSEAEGKGTLVVRSGKARYEIRGEVERREGEVTLRVQGDEIDQLFSRDGGTLILKIEDGRVRSVRGKVRIEGQRFEFGDSLPRDSDDNHITPGNEISPTG